MTPATLLALLPIIDASMKAAQRMLEILQRCAKDNRDPTPEEWEEINARRKDAESRWASLAPTK